MGLGAKGTTGEPFIRALGHEANEDFLRLLQVGQEQALELAAPVRVVGKVLELLQRQGQMSFADLLSEDSGRGKTRAPAARSVGH